MMTSPLLRPLLLAAFAALCLAGPSAAHASPAPYPDGKDETAWPGRGPVRLHPWMHDNRAYFWTRRDQDQGAVVFVGSSMIGGWKTLAADFPHLKVANRGIGGDVSRGLLFRFQEDVLDLQPRAIVIAIGSNDLSAHADPAAVAENVASLIDLARAQNPKLPIVVCPVAPRADPKAPLKPGALEDYNARIRALGAEKNVAVPDLTTPFVDAEGAQILEYYGKDRLHFTPAGYQKLAAIVRAELKRIGIE